MKPDLLAQLADLANGDQWRIADLLVEEFTFKEFALSGQRPTIYVIVRVE